LNRVFNKAKNECDVFIFIWSSFFTDFSDYKILKSLNKKIITFFVGDDIRWQSAMEQDFTFYKIPHIEYSDIKNTPISLNQKLRFLRTAEKYSDIIFSAPNQSQLALRPYHKIFVPVNIEKYPCNDKQREIPLVCHAPSVSAGKGTKYVLKAIDRLKDEGLSFEFRLIQDIPHNEAINGGHAINNRGLLCS